MTDAAQGAKFNLSLLIKLLKLTTSSNDAEALLACRKANEQLKHFGGDWEALLSGKVTIIETPRFDNIPHVVGRGAAAPPPPPPPRPTPQPQPQPRWQPPPPRPAPAPKPPKQRFKRGSVSLDDLV